MMTDQERIDAIAATLRSLGDSAQTAAREAGVIMALAKTIAEEMKKTPDRLSDEEVMGTDDK